MPTNEQLNAKGELTVRVIAMPTNTNAAGDVFGGWVMSQMDLAANTIAIRHAATKCSTVSIDGAAFLAPMSVGDELSIYTELLRVGRTSLTISVEAWRRARDTSQTQKVTHGKFVFVAQGPDNRPIPVYREGNPAPSETLPA